MLWILLAGTVAVLFYYRFVKPLSYWKTQGIKQSKPLIFFGDNAATIFRTKSFTEWVEQVYKMFPGHRYSGIYQFYVPTLVVRDPELIKQITVKDFDHFTDHRTFVDPEADPLWGKNLFSLRGQPWREMRATLSGSFTSSKMKHMFGLMKEASENFVQYFLKNYEKNEELEFKAVFTRFTNDVIATTAFGNKVDSLEHPNNEFYVMGKEATNFNGIRISLRFFGYMAFPKLFKWLKITLFTKRVANFFRNLIKDTIKTREEMGIVRNDMINLLLEARKGNYVKREENNVIDSGFAVAQESPGIGKTTKLPKNITDDDITSQALVFFFGGFDSVSNLMCYLAYELGVNQDIQEKLREEIKKTSDECGGNLTYEALMKMKYMDMVITETLRKWPVAVLGDRVCTKAYTIQPETPEEQPLQIQKGEVIMFPIYGIHRDPENYPNPDKFDPERFCDENKDNIKPYTYLPFGVGPRNCIGSRFALLETKTVFFKLLQKFEIVPTAKTPVPFKFSRKAISMMPVGGFMLGLKRILLK